MKRFSRVNDRAHRPNGTLNSSSKMAAPMNKRKHDDEKKDLVSEAVSEVSSNKKQKTSSESTASLDDPLTDFNGFAVEKILSENSQTKTLFVQGTFDGSESKAVVLLEKTAFRTNELPVLMSKETKLKASLKNDIYGVYEGLPMPELNGLKTTVIYPATEKHIRKYTYQQLYLVTETWQDYQQITLPYLNEQRFSIQWVFNILDKKAESERIVYEDTDPELGFVLLPDMKWDGKQTDALYLIAICHKRGIKSLRDLTADHLPLLKNIKEKCLTAVKTNYNIPPEQLRMYIHYQPSYYHLHVHVTHLKNVAPGTQAEKAHLLTDVIENIELMSDYYQKKSLTFALRESDGLLAKFKQAGKVLVTSISVE